MAFAFRFRPKLDARSRGEQLSYPAHLVQIGQALGNLNYLPADSVGPTPRYFALKACDMVVMGEGARRTSLGRGHKSGVLRAVAHGDGNARRYCLRSGGGLDLRMDR